MGGGLESDRDESVWNRVGNVKMLLGAPEGTNVLGDRMGGRKNGGKNRCHSEAH
jgi:hypothetical protein